MMLFWFRNSSISVHFTKMVSTLITQFKTQIRSFQIYRKITYRIPRK